MVFGFLVFLQHFVIHHCFFVIYTKAKQGESVYLANECEFFNARHEVDDDWMPGFG